MSISLKLFEDSLSILQRKYGFWEVRIKFNTCVILCTNDHFNNKNKNKNKNNSYFWRITSVKSQSTYKNGND